MSKIIQIGNEILRKKAKEIKKEEFSLDNLDNLIKEMKETLNKEEDGFALAAPQIGESVRIFIISGKLFQHLKGTDEPQSDKIYINPKILKTSKETELMEEGCLSIRNWYGKVKRYKKIKIEAFDQDGKKFQEGASGILSQAFQHEIDHLDGILFTDIATELEKIEPPQKK